MTTLETRNKQQFEADAAAFLEKLIKEYAATSPANALSDFDGDRVFDEPLVGFADGDDPIFSEYKRVIGRFHMTPREVMERHFHEKGINRRQPEKVSVISFVMPISYATRLSLRRETLIPSVRWNRTRWQGEEMIDQLAGHLTEVFEQFGFYAVVPDRASFYQGIELPEGRSSNWSQRHAAYAAGLGTFSLSDGFITPKGMAMRCGSVVTDAGITATPRLYKDRLANCPFYIDRSCRACIERCPADAITEAGHDKVKCRDFLINEQRAIIRKMGKEGDYIGRYLGCGLCQVKVPCEARIPARAVGRNLKQLTAIS